MAGSRERSWALTVRLGGGAAHQRLALGLKEHGDNGCARRLVELALLGLLAEEAGFTQAAVRGEFTLVSPSALFRPAPGGGERPPRARHRQTAPAKPVPVPDQGARELVPAPAVETVVNPEAASAWDALRSQFG